MAVSLQLLKKVETGWEPDGSSLRFEDDTRDTVREKAIWHAEAWAVKDPPNRQYRLDETP